MLVRKMGSPSDSDGWSRTGRCARTGGADRPYIGHGYSTVGVADGWAEGFAEGGRGARGRRCAKVGDVWTGYSNRWPASLALRASGEAGPDGAGVGRNAPVWTDVGVWMREGRAVELGSTGWLYGGDGREEWDWVDTGVGSGTGGCRGGECHSVGTGVRRCDCLSQELCFGVLMRAAIRGDGDVGGGWEAGVYYGCGSSLLADLSSPSLSSFPASSSALQLGCFHPTP